MGKTSPTKNASGVSKDSLDSSSSEVSYNSQTRLRSVQNQLNECPTAQRPWAEADSNDNARARVAKCKSNAERARKQLDLVDEADHKAASYKQAAEAVVFLEKQVADWEVAAAAHQPPRREPTRAAEYKHMASELPAYGALPSAIGKEPTYYDACGFLIYKLKEEKVGGKWTKQRLSYNLNRKVTTTADCKVPKSQRKWAKFAKAAKKRMPTGLRDSFRTGDKVVITASDWTFTRHQITDRIIAREVFVYHYSKKHKAEENVCGGTSSQLVCEEADNAYSDLSQKANEAQWHLNQAKELEAEGKNIDCRLAAWRVARETHDKEWRRGTTYDELKYKTRWNGTLSYSELKGLYKKLDTEAHALFQQCGGAATIPLK